MCRKIRNGLLMTAFGLMVFQTVAEASSCGTEEPLAVKVSLRDGSIMAGAPVILNVEVTNNTGVAVQLVAGWAPSLGNTSYELRGEETGLVAHTATRDFTQVRVEEQGGLVMPDVLAAGSKRSIRVLLNRLVPLSKPGRYELVFHWSIPYRFQGTIGGASSEPKVHREDFSIRFSLSPINERKLRKTVLDLLESLSAAKRTESETRNDLSILFDVPERYSAGAWRILATDYERFGKIRWWVVRELDRVGTRTAIDILGEMWAADLAREGTSSIRLTLLLKYYKSNMVMRTQIGRMFLAAEGSLPPPEDKNKPKVKVHTVD